MNLAAEGSATMNDPVTSWKRHRERCARCAAATCRAEYCEAGWALFVEATKKLYGSGA